MAGEEIQLDVDRFIMAEIDTVPHLEALLILWEGRHRVFTLRELATVLYLPDGEVERVAGDLVRRRLAREEPEGIRYEPEGPANPEFLPLLETTYRRELIRMSRMIHVKPPAAVRDFARAFRLTREREK